MKISIITGKELKHPEVKILCKEKNNEVIRIEQILSATEQCVMGNYDGKSIKIRFADILYFEMVDRSVFAYTKDIVARRYVSDFILFLKNGGNDQ